MTEVMRLFDWFATGKALKDGKTVILPCDTIYSLSARADEEKADELYEIKARSSAKSFITLMTLGQLRESGLIVPERLYSLWPAPLTAVLSSAEGGTVAVRVPRGEYINKVLSVSGPIYSTSVNISGQPSLLTFEDILPVFSGKVDIIVEDRSIKGGRPSTLIDATSEPFKVLRQGEFVI